MDLEDEQQVRVKFITQNPAIRVTDTPFAVPLRLARHGLSQVINHLLNTTSPRPFDFLVDGTFLRTTLQKYMEKNGISEENVLTLEYLEVMHEPKTSHEQEHPDWVSTIACTPQLVCTGCYDGVLRVYSSTDGKCLVSLKAHEAPIKAIDIQRLDGNVYRIVTCSKDHSVRTWKFSEPLQNGSTSCTILPCQFFQGHSDSVDSVTLSKFNHEVASGSWDGSIRIWSIKKENECDVSFKKQRTEEDPISSVRESESKNVLLGHSGCVSGVAFDPSNVLHSAAWDRTIKIWNLETTQCVQTLNGNRAFTSLSLSDQTGLIATASPDQAVRIWDKRVDGESVMKLCLKSHKDWVSCVQWQPNSDHLLASTAYDGTAKVWDIRSSTPIYTIAAHNEKALCVSWITQDKFATGGSDCKLKFYSCDQQQECP